MHILLTMFNPLLIAPIVAILAFIFYDYVSATILYLNLPLLLIYFIFFIPFLSFFNKIVFKIRNENDLLSLRGWAWELFGFLIITVSLFQFYFFGIPILGDLVYADFGFPFFHHIAVSSWLFVFIKYRSRFLVLFFNLFMFVNPLLIMNRDLLLLTIFVFFVRFYLINKLRFLHFLFLLVIVFVLFGLLGELRSGYAFDIVELPIKFNIKEFSQLFFWFFIYLTSSSFNAGFNIDFNTFDLYSKYINVFPEYYKFYVYFGSLGFYSYFFIASLIILYIFLLFKDSKYVLFLFFIFQFVMGSIFADKFFISHSLFVLLVFSIIGFLNYAKDNVSKYKF